MADVGDAVLGLQARHVVFLERQPPLAQVLRRRLDVLDLERHERVTALAGADALVDAELRGPSLEASLPVLGQALVLLFELEPELLGVEGDPTLEIRDGDDRDRAGGSDHLPPSVAVAASIATILAPPPHRVQTREPRRVGSTHGRGASALRAHTGDPDARRGRLALQQTIVLPALPDLPAGVRRDYLTWSTWVMTVSCSPPRSRRRSSASSGTALGRSDPRRRALDFPRGTSAELAPGHRHADRVSRGRRRGRCRLPVQLRDHPRRVSRRQGQGRYWVSLRRLRRRGRIRIGCPA